MEFQVIYLVLFHLFSLVDGFEWYWTGSHHKLIQLTLEFAVAPFLVLPFSCYTLTTFLMLCLILNIYADKAIVYCKCDQASDL